MGKYLTPRGVEVSTSEKAALAVGYKPVDSAPAESPAKKAPVKKTAAKKSKK